MVARDVPQDRHFLLRRLFRRDPFAAVVAQIDYFGSVGLARLLLDASPHRRTYPPEARLSPKLQHSRATHLPRISLGSYLA